MAGDIETGVTIHKTIKELDAGPIAAQRAFPISPEDDAGAVYAKAAEFVVELLQPEATFTDQPAEGVTYAEKISAADRELDLTRPAQELVNHVRALSPHIGARTELHGRPVTVWKARVGDGTFEPVEVQPDGRRRMTYDEFLRGLR
jgi:methionyl-tRNA formyltransferase